VVRVNPKYKNRRRPDWGITPSEMANKMTSGRFMKEQREKKSKAKRTKLFHNIRRVDRCFEGESKIFYDKLGFKKMMNENNILTPKTYAIVDRKKRLEKFWDEVKELDTFVLKPDRMSEGRGIRVLEKTDNPEIWREMNGDNISVDTIHKEIIGHLNRMTNNRRVRGDRNKVFAEERIFVHKSLKDFSIYNGIVDFRVYVMIDQKFKKKEVLYAKMRCPNKESGGMGNTAKGATALFIDVDGVVKDSDIFNNVTTKYKKTNYSGVKMPMWDKVKERAEEVGALFKSPFHSVDMTVNEDGEVVVIESEKIPLLRYFMDAEAERITNRIINFAEEVLWK